MIYRFARSAEDLFVHRSLPLTTANDFLRAICEAPDDDSPRLVFADWLEERGDARGEFIRLQCELEQLDEDDPTRAEHESRCQLLLAMHKTSWLGDLPRMVRDFRFRRGFVHWVQLSAKNFLAHGETIFELAPIRQVTINDINSYLDEVADCPHLARLEGLDIKPEFSWRQNDYPASLLTDLGCLALLCSEHISGLTALDVGYNRLTHRGPQLVSAEVFKPRSPNAIRRLRRLDLSHNEIEDAGVAALADWGDSLVDLALNNNPFRRFPARILAEHPSFRQLEVLRIESTNISSEGVEELIGGPGPAHFAELFLDGNSLNDQCLRTLGLSSASTRLKELSLNSISRSGDTCAVSLSTGTDLGNLRCLGFRHNHTGPKGAEALATSSLRSLRLLDLRDNAIGDAGCAAIANSSNLANLTTLLLAENAIGDAGAWALVESPYLERVVEIRLGNNPIGSAARHALQSRFGHRVIFDS